MKYTIILIATMLTSCSELANINVNSGQIEPTQETCVTRTRYMGKGIIMYYKDCK